MARSLKVKGRSWKSLWGFFRSNNYVNSMHLFIDIDSFRILLYSNIISFLIHEKQCTLYTVDCGEGLVGKEGILSVGKIYKMLFVYHYNISPNAVLKKKLHHCYLIITKQ